MQVAYGLCLVNYTGIIVVHAVDVSPDLDLIGLDGGAQDGCCVVTASALQVVDVTVHVAADKALCDVDLHAGNGFELLGCVLCDELHVRLCVCIGLHEIEGGQESSLDTLLLEVEGYHVG